MIFFLLPTIKKKMKPRSADGGHRLRTHKRRAGRNKQEAQMTKRNNTTNENADGADLVMTP